MKVTFLCQISYHFALQSYKIIRFSPSADCPSDLLSSEMALLGCPLSFRLAPPPKILVASNDLCPGTYLAFDRQNLHLPGFLLAPGASEK